MSATLLETRLSHLKQALVNAKFTTPLDCVDWSDIDRIWVEAAADKRSREEIRSHMIKDEFTWDDDDIEIFGASLTTVLALAGTNETIDDVSYELPLVIVKCIKELSQSPIGQPGLFRTPPNLSRHHYLIEVFNEYPTFGVDANLSLEPSANICALFDLFLHKLPDPIVPDAVAKMLSSFCIQPSSQISHETRRRARAGSLASVRSWERDTFPEEDHLTIIATCVLRLLPYPNLSLLAYLLDFFTQLPLFPQNGLQNEDICRMFKKSLFGAGHQHLMEWLLPRWHVVCPRLLSSEDDFASARLVTITPPVTWSESPGSIASSTSEGYFTSSNTSMSTRSSNSSDDQTSSSDKSKRSSILDAVQKEIETDWRYSDPQSTASELAHLVHKLSVANLRITALQDELAIAEKRLPRLRGENQRLKQERDALSRKLSSI